MTAPTINAHLHVQQSHSAHLGIDTVPAISVHLGGVMYDRGADIWGGPYEVTPETWEQTLGVSGYRMGRDVTVHEIPYGEVSNEAGGRTATIAS